MRGRTVRLRLQKPTETKTSTGADSTTWEDVVDFRGTLQADVAWEGRESRRETAEAISVCYVNRRDIGRLKVNELKEKNRIFVPNRENEFSPQFLDITSVQRQRSRNGQQVSFFKVFLKEIK